MPWKIVKDGEQFCVHKENADGSAGDKVKCHPTEAEAQVQMKAMYANMENEAMKYQALSLPIKAMGDWELDVLALPYNKKDGDRQWFDNATDIMPDTFNNPAIIYHHGVMPGLKGFEKAPVIIGKSTGFEKRSDGLHVMVLLDKTLDYAKRVWEAAKKGIAVASSDSITHLARLEVGGGKRIMYEKERPGRIAVWPLAGISLWDNVDENFTPASRYAIALPAMKAIYREAGLPFPEITNTHDDLPETDLSVVKRTRIQKQARAYLSTLDE